MGGTNRCPLRPSSARFGRRRPPSLLWRSPTDATPPLWWDCRTGGRAAAPAAHRPSSAPCCPTVTTWSSAPTTAGSTRPLSPLPARPSATTRGCSMPRRPLVRTRDVMTREVVTVAPGTSVKAAAEILATRGFAAAPVVDEEDRLVGIVSEADLLRGRLLPDRRLRLRRDARPGSAPPPAHVGGVMTTDV